MSNNKSATIAPLQSFLQCSRRGAYYSQEYARAIHYLSETTGENLEQQVMAGTIGLTMKAVRQIARAPASQHKALIAEARANRGRLLKRKYHDVDRAVEVARLAINELARCWPTECNGCTLAKTLRYFANEIEGIDREGQE